MLLSNTWAIVSCFLLHELIASVLACACSFSICWRAVYTFNRCLQRLLVLQFFRLFEACNELRQQHSQRNVTNSHSSLAWPSVTQEKRARWTRDMTIQFYSSFNTNPQFFLTALVSAPIPIPVLVEPYSMCKLYNFITVC